MVVNKADNFRSIFSWKEGDIIVNGITIPIVQRDYAQGRTTADVNRIRNRFLKVLYDALVENKRTTLDFIYGNIEKDQLIPLDGQQRLTTLFLLHYYIAQHEHISEDEWEFLHHFTYETRVSSREFCQHIVKYTPDFELQTLSEQIQDEAWFLLEWESDPTVKSMLVMLDAIHTMFHDTYGLWQKLMGDAITFYFLPLGNLGVTDELYIKMNSRGKPLTNFEHFKAELELQMKEVDEDSAKRIIRKIDREWSDLLWPYRNSETGNQQADAVTDDEFLRYIHFVSDLISYQNNEVEIKDEFDIIEKQFSKANPQAMENMKILESMFDIWTTISNIDEFFNDYFSVAEYQPNKTKIDKQPNLFLDCCAHYGIIIGKRPQFPLGRFIMLYCFVLKLEHPELSDANFRRRLRIVNNLVNNSVNTLRSDFMKELLAQVDKIVLMGIVEQVEEGKARFQSKQMDEERLKLEWTQKYPEMAETLFRLEDHPYLNGYIKAVGFEHVDWCDRFYSLFNCSHHSVNKALLAIGDYFEKDAWRYQIGIGDFVVNRNVKDRMWQELFSPIRLEDSLCTVLQQLLSQRETFDDDYLNGLVATYLQETKEYPLRYYIVKYDSMRTNRDGRYNNYGKYYWRHHNDWPKKDEDKQRELRLKDYNVILMSTEWSLGGYNHDLFLKTLYDLAGGESAGLVLDNYSYTRYNETIDGQKGVDKLRLSNGFYLTLADNVYNVYNANGEVLGSHKILQNDAGIDIENRVELGVRLIENQGIYADHNNPFKEQSDSTGYIELDRDEILCDGIAPRQRKVYVLRWNPSISSFTREGFEDYFAQYKGNKPFDNNNKLDWTIWDWKSVEHRDLYVMMQVGQKVNGIVWGGFLGGYPYQYKKEDGSLTKSHFFETDVEYMHRIENTGLMTADRLIKAVPKVDWLHGHSGELLSVEDAEKLGLFLVNELKDVEENDDIYFDSYNQKQYVIADILTFMCPELKKRLLAMGKNKDPEIQDINELMIHVDDEDYSNWAVLEDHLSLQELNGVML